MLRPVAGRGRAPTPLDRAPPLRIALAALTLAMLLPLAASAQTPAGTPIDNQATATFDLGAALGLTQLSNLHTVIVAALRTPATAELLQHAPAASGAQNVAVPASRCSSTGLTAGPFNPVPPPTQLDGTPIALPGPVDLLPANQYTLGAPVFIRLTDTDQNLNPALAETVLVRLTTAADSELVELTETAISSGIFTGHIQSQEGAATANDCVLQGAAAGTAAASYTDPADPSDTASDSAELSPQASIFDSSTGGSLDGVTVAIVDDATGLPASVFGDDGVSPFPATVTTGGTFSDGVKTYVFPAGTYRFPQLRAGTYRLVVTPPTGFLAPSAVADPALQALPGAPFALSGASRGLAFTLATASAIDVDIPIDPSAVLPFLVKSTSTSEAAVGDFVQYNLGVRNPGIAAAPLGVLLTDRLPLGFRYQTGSARFDDLPTPDPVVSANGRELTFTLGTTPLPALQNVRYVLELTSSTPLGEAVNFARADVIGGAESLVASATILVREELFSSSTLLMGQVAVGGSTSSLDASSGAGLPGVRVYLEDGSYSVTDQNGFFHFEGVGPGVHVVQLDMDSLPPQYEPVPLTQNTRFSGRTFSQFVDVQAGTLWRTDFRVALRAPREGYVNAQLRTRLEDGIAHYEVEVRGGGVPVRDLRVISLLPSGVHYVPGSSRLDGVPVDEPELAEGVLTHRLDDPAGLWTRILSFEGETGGSEPDQRHVTRSFALFRTPTAAAVRTPVAQAVLLQDSRSVSDLRIIGTQGLRPGDEWQQDAVPAQEEPPAPEESAPLYDLAWLRQAQPGLEWLEPAPGHAPEIPSISIVVKHPRQSEIELELNGEPVPRVNLSGRLTTEASAITTWGGVDLVEGTNHFVATARMPDGGSESLDYEIHYSGPPVRAALVQAESTLVANGRDAPTLAVRLFDRFDMPARKGVVGEFEVRPPYQARRDPESLESRKILGLDPAKNTFTVGDDGIALIELEPTSETGKVELRLNLQGNPEESVTTWLEPEERDWVLVGLAEGTVAYNRLSGNMETLDALGIDEHGSNEQRISLFAKGRVRGEWLLTLAYDSDRHDDKRGEGLAGMIDPDRYYTLYGSKAQQRFEAPTSERLYVKLERRQFYALFGDYDTGLEVTELARYSRGFTGLKTEYQGERLSFSGFATDTRQGFIRDEIQGKGISGLYRLSRSDLLLNSEKVTIETRDRFKTELILASQEMTRFVDYNVDYGAGTLYFSSPVQSKDSSLNPIFIVVEYESEDDKDESVIAGGRGAVHLMDDRLELGASLVHEGHTGQEGDLVGGDLRFDLDDHTSFRAEYAGTSTDATSGSRNGAAFLAELQTTRAQLSARAYLREQEADFGLGQQSQTEEGTRKFGVESRYELSDQTSLVGQAYRQTNLETGVDRDVLEARADHRMSDLNVYSGYRLARDSGGANPAQESQQLLAGGSWDTLGNRLRLRLDNELTLGGSDENPDFPMRTIFGADYELGPKVTLFAEQELTFGDKEDTRASRLGFRSTPWKGGRLTSSLEQRADSAGPLSFANLGLAQTWQVNDRWGVEASLDSSHTLRDPGNVPWNASVPPASGTRNDDFTAISLGSTYRSALWAWTGRVETRSGELENKWGVYTGFVQELNEGIGYSLALEYFDTSAAGGVEGRDTDLELGLVYRRPGSRWILLNRLNLVAEDRDGSTFQFQNRKLINNLNLNYQWSPGLQISLQYGGKYVAETIDGSDYDGYIDIWGIELRRDLGDRWDLGLHARLHSSWEADVVQSSYGVELGYQLRTNLWLSVGYNFGGIRDDDFSDADYTRAGPYLKFRYKFDQQTIRELLDWERTRKRPSRGITPPTP